MNAAPYKSILENISFGFGSFEIVPGLEPDSRYFQNPQGSGGFRHHF